MALDRPVDTTFDFRSDTPEGRDPDIYSRTLRAYHHQLWNKALPSGDQFTLSVSTPGAYLHHQSHLGTFTLTSDSVIPSFRKAKRLASIIAGLPEGYLATFMTVTYTIGGMMVFPGNKVDGKMTINGARGFHRKLRDRFDLTIECIRRYYYGEPNPFEETLSRYASFFALFGSFRGYIDFFLLQDLVSMDYSKVLCFAPYDDFMASPVPADLPAYLSYGNNALAFVRARNVRIQGWCQSAG